MSINEIISIKGLSKSYGSTRAVDNLSLSVGKGEFFGFLGPNGAGKTTTIRMISGIIKPDSGKITVSGFTENQKEEITRLLGILPESRGFYDWMTATEYLSFFAALYRIPEKQADKKIIQLLEQVDLLKSKEKKIGTYSRGMKQRLGLARTLINDPQLLILDEPTLGLDPQGQVDIQNLLMRLNSQGVTIFYSSHLLHEVSKLCSPVAIINQGRLVAQGTCQELMEKTKSQSLADVFLTLTQTQHD